jgi:ATP-dependent 26S proteasome regulatory subunit
MILVEDFEMFVSNPQELQLIFNTLDGIATPDNPAGTLLLATSSDPERIDQRIRDRAGRIDVLIEIGPVQDKELAVRFLKHFLGSAYHDEEHAAVASELLRQPGSHFREVCISATIQALEQGRDHVSGNDIVSAHHAILAGRAIASQPERFVPSSVRKQGRYFSKSR